MPTAHSQEQVAGSELRRLVPARALLPVGRSSSPQFLKSHLTRLEKPLWTNAEQFEASQNANQGIDKVKARCRWQFSVLPFRFFALPTSMYPSLQIAPSSGLPTGLRLNVEQARLDVSSVFGFTAGISQQAREG
jgi:hypothetical protein